MPKPENQQNLHQSFNTQASIHKNITQPADSIQTKGGQISFHKLTNKSKNNIQC